MNARAPALRNQMFLSFVVGVLGMCVAWEAGNVIVAGNLRMLFLIGLGFAGCAVAVAILQSWRTGFYLFLGWLLFEDLVRKYMGNGAVFFFGKDVLVLLVYISFMWPSAAVAKRHSVRHFCFSSACFSGSECCRCSTRTPPTSCTDCWASRFISTMFRFYLWDTR